MHETKPETEPKANHETPSISQLLDTIKTPQDLIAYIENNKKGGGVNKIEREIITDVTSSIIHNEYTEIGNIVEMVICVLDNPPDTPPEYNPFVYETTLRVASEKITESLNTANAYIKALNNNL